MPFFFWFQLLWVIVSAVFTAVVYLRHRRLARLLGLARTFTHKKQKDDGGGVVPNVNWVALSIFVLLFGFITWLGFAAANWRKGDLDHAARMGPRRPALRHGRHLVPGRWRSLYRLHLHRRSRARLWRRCGRLLRGALHDRDLSVSVPGVSAPVVRLPQARLHHRRGFRARPVRQSLARARGEHHRHRRHHALHRPAARRHPSRDRCARHLRYGRWPRICR